MQKSGRRGEMEVMFPLRFLDEQDYLILHDLRLQDQRGFFQIDTLILCEKFILILEVKNWSGTIMFGENGQVTRVNPENMEEGFPNPILQAKLQQHRLQKWLSNHGCSDIPIDFLVVISFPSTIIKSLSPEQPIPDNVVHNNQLLFRIQELEQLYHSRQLGMDQLMKLSHLLADAHVPEKTTVMERFGIAADELIKGVFCPQCGAVPMGRKLKKWWYCTKCHHQSADAHLPALQEYKLLFSKSISNGEARKFLRVDSAATMKYILQKENFRQFGKTNTRRYIIK
jgi:ribosomal protein L37AE/L43A